MNLWKSLGGMVEVELTSAAAETLLEEIRRKNIVIYHFCGVSDLTSRFQLMRKDYDRVCRIVQKRGETLRIIQKNGIYWRLHVLFKRPVLFLGILFLLLLTWVIPRYVFFVEVTGNDRIPTNQILEAGEKCGIFFGAERKAVRSEKVKNALLSALPQLQWAGVNTRGCVAIISVRERSAEEKVAPRHEVSSIVAHTDGVILGCTATKGTLICREGQAVREGQLLISGYTDCGLSIQATAAQGEIYALTNRELTVISPSNWAIPEEETEKLQSISLLIGKKRINLWKDSGIWEGSCGRMYKEYYLTLPGGFRLPFALCFDTFRIRRLTDGKLDAKVLELSEFAQRYLTDRMIAGKILQSEETLKTNDGFIILQGNYVCTEMIGRVQPEKIGE